MTATQSNPGPLPALAVRAKDAARLCGVSLATWHRLNSAGMVPRPFKRGRCVLWSVDTLRTWVAEQSAAVN